MNNEKKRITVTIVFEDWVPVEYINTLVEGLEKEKGIFMVKQTRYER